MINTALVNKQVEDICGAVSSMALSGRIRYYISILNPSLSRDMTEVYRGSNCDNVDVEKKQPWYYGKEMPAKFREHLTDVVNNPTNAKVWVEIRDGGNNKKAAFEIVLRDEYADYPARHKYDLPDPQPAQPQTQTQNQQPAQPQMSPFSGLGSINDFLGTMFGGLGATEQTGLGAVIGVRDQLVRNEFERREMEANRQRDLDKMRDEYERKEMDRRLGEIRDERDDYRRKNRELEEQVRKLERDVERKCETILDLEAQVADLEKMKPEHSIAGVALTGVGLKVAESLLLRHAGTVGKLFGIGKEDMLGMLQADAEEPIAMPQPSVSEETASVAVAGEDDENPRAGRAESLKTLLYSFTDEEYEAFWKVVMYLDEYRDQMLAMAQKLEQQ